MITKAIGYQTSKGEIHPTLNAAQKAELSSFLKEFGVGPNFSDAEGVAELIVENSDKFIDILTTGPKSRPKARSINGAKRRSPKKVNRHEAEQFELLPPVETAAVAQ